jgi:hypothetical protein
MSKPAPTTIKSWDSWQSAPSGNGLSTPATLPPLGIPQPPPATSADASGSFVPNGTLTLPKRAVPAATDLPPLTAVGTPIGTGTRLK